MIKTMSGPSDVLLDSKRLQKSPNASFVLSTWMLKSPTISALSTLTNRSERKSANSFRKSVYGPGGLYTVARARDRTDFFCISDSVTLSRSISNELNLYPVFWVTLRISLYIVATPFGSPSFKNCFCSFNLHFSGLITIRFFLDPA